MKNKHTAFYPADILLPKNEDYSKWAVVACDQFTSQPEYWEEVEKNVGNSKSTLKLVLPEAYLEEDDVDDRINDINSTMEEYLESDTFECYENSIIYIERTQSDGKVRHGLVGMIDLEEYEFEPGNHAQIRATEATVISRIPPRVEVRKNAPIELPHVMLLIDDPDKTVIEPITEQVQSSKPIYDFDMMQGGGHIKGWVLDANQNEAIENSLQKLNTEEEMERKYGLKNAAPMLFAVGDGNHSLATAKKCYELAKKEYPESEWANLPCRYALVEVVNNHDDALHFEPIHRVLFDVEADAVPNAMKNCIPGAYDGVGEGHVIRYAYRNGTKIVEGAITVPNPEMQLEVGTLQKFLDVYVDNIKRMERYENSFNIMMDYIHGDDTAMALGTKAGEYNMAFLLPAMEKSQLFKTVMMDGVLPRKTFSMGHAEDKRYYLEARRIK